MINKQKGNMYPWVTHTWNPIKGDCPHDCIYCYMKQFPLGDIRLDNKCFRDNLGNGNIIFVGSSVDMWAEKIPDKWINTVLVYIKKYPENIYLFQSKNPERFKHHRILLPNNCILGTTIETNRNYNVSIAPSVEKRCQAISKYDMQKMVSIEPIIDFDLEPFVKMIQGINPSFVSIGADSKNHNLPEPTGEKTKQLIRELEEFTDVRVKKNLKRILK